MVELLAPVGSMESFYSAIENKADAIYLGGKMFGARAYSNNFSNEEIRELINYAHLYDVKVYLTVNTIVFDNEIDELIKFLDFIYLNNCDGIIVQDLGIVNIARKRYPDLELHASTQMNIHNLSDVQLLKELGFTRIVLAREVSIEEIRLIKEKVGIELEVFIHGSLCVSYSGNCLYSSFNGGRSGNRGRCAQPCRLQYKIDDKDGYFISPKDLSSLKYIDQLIEAGVDSLKIEGRMKRPEYVAQMVMTYRDRIDSYYNKVEFDYDFHNDQIKRIFNRDFTKGFLFNEDNNNFINKVHSNHIGVEIGEVIASHDKQITIRLSKDLSYGDSIRVVGNTQDAITVNQIYLGEENFKKATSGDVVRIRSHIDGLDGAKVYLTSDYNQLNNLKQSYLNPSRKIEIEGKSYIEDDYLVLEAKSNKVSVKLRSTSKVEVAQKIAVNERLKEQFMKTNDTKFVFSKLDIDIERDIFIRIKEINELRRKVLEVLESKLTNNHQRVIEQYNFRETMAKYKQKNEGNNPKIKVKVRNIEQLNVLLDYDIDEIYVTDLSLLYFKTEKNVIIKYAIPRIMDNEKLDLIQAIDSSRLVSSNIGRIAKTSSVYLNISNIYAVEFLELLGVDVVGLSVELTGKQIADLVRNYRVAFGIDPNLEIMVYGKYELMMMKYSLISEHYADSKDTAKLVDRKNVSYDVIREDETDKIFSDRKVNLIDYLEELKEVGVNNFLLDFTNEEPGEVKEVMDIFLKGKDNNLEDTFMGHYKEGIL